MTTIIWVTYQFPALHRWPAAKNFLKDYHRHLFHVKLGVQVGGLDREVEFFDLKSNLEKFIDSRWKDKSFDLSCEQMATILANEFKAAFVEVSEDGENGATVSSM